MFFYTVNIFFILTKIKLILTKIKLMSYSNKPSKSKASKYKKLPTLNINHAIQL